MKYAASLSFRQLPYCSMAIWKNAAGGEARLSKPRTKTKGTLSRSLVIPKG
jgi:hypothetical protein